MTQNNLPFVAPEWFNKLDYEKKEDRLVMNKYFIHQAALYSSPSLTLEELARQTGVSKVALYYTYAQNHPSRGVLSLSLAAKLMRVTGGRLPLEVMRPDEFL